MATLSLLAIGAGTLAGITISAAAGALFGLGFALDVQHDSQADGADPDEADRLFEQAFASASHRPVFALQLTAISIASAAVSGAVTAWFAPAAPLANAAAVGLIGTGLGLVAARLGPPPPPLLNALGLLTTLPATLFGAWLLS